MDIAYHFEGVCATHPHAKIIWPFLVPVHADILVAQSQLQDFPPFPRRLTRVSGMLRDLIIDAEFGVLNATPERYVAHLRQLKS